MRVVLWSVFAALLLVMWGRELAVFVQARRERADTRRDMRRFKRRTLGLVLLLLMALLYDMAGLMAAHVREGAGVPWIELVYYGLFFALLILLLLVVARDFRDIAEGYIEARHDMTMRTLVEMDRDLRGPSGEEDQPIPPMEFPREGGPRGGTKEH